jgi:hypothetical protein
VAETLAQAKDAAELIDIDYELPSVTDTAEAAGQDCGTGRVPGQQLEPIRGQQQNRDRGCLRKGAATSSAAITPRAPFAEAPTLAALRAGSGRGACRRAGDREGAAR